MKQTNQYSQALENAHTGDLVSCEARFNRSSTSQNIIPVLHKRAAEIHGRIRQIESTLKPSELAVYRYIVNNTIGRNKDNDQIANSQFTGGKTCSTTGQVIDFGCGLSSINAVRKARKALIQKGIIFEESVTNVYGTSEANRYGLTFVRDLLELESQPVSDKKSHYTRRGYHEVYPTIKTPTEFEIQRCGTTAKKSKKQKNYYMHPEHVDYLINTIETITGDTHSRGAFAEITLTVEEGTIMELLAVLRDRDNINNKGAWFLSAAKRYQQKRILKADQPEPKSVRGEGEDSIPSTVSLRELLSDQKPELAELLDMNRSLTTQAVHEKFIVGK